MQIEYEYTCGEPQSERLYAWYEGKLGFDGGSAPTSTPGRCEFRRCRKRLEPRATESAASDSSTTASPSSGRATPMDGKQRTGGANCWGRVLRFLRSVLAC